MRTSDIKKPRQFALDTLLFCRRSASKGAEELGPQAISGCKVGHTTSPQRGDLTRSVKPPVDSSLLSHCQAKNLDQIGLELLVDQSTKHSVF
jgi:hypothetical protein